jgi:glycosyltransferase involved in cell wall biosynthesis
MNKLITIILPTYNGGKYIKKAIESVLSQSFLDWELLIIDDGSSDNTQEIVQDFIYKNKRISYFKNEVNLGIQKSLNKGLKEAMGEYIARIDDDDEWTDKNKLKKQVEFLDNNPGYVLVGTGAVVVNEDGKEIIRYLLPETDQEIRNRLLIKNCFIHSSVLFRKETVLKFNGYSEGEDVKYLEDYDLWFKLGTVGKLANLQEWSINFMMREGSTSSKNKIDQLRKNLLLIKKYKSNYPNHSKAKILGNLRVCFYRISNLIPLVFKNKLIKIYKEF